MNTFYRYEKVLKQIHSSGISYTRFHATWMAVSKVLMDISYFLTVWFGTNMIIAGEIEVNSIITVRLFVEIFKTSRFSLQFYL